MDLHDHRCRSLAKLLTIQQLSSSVGHHAGAGLSEIPNRGEVNHAVQENLNRNR